MAWYIVILISLSILFVGCHSGGSNIMRERSEESRATAQGPRTASASDNAVPTQAELARAVRAAYASMQSYDVQMRVLESGTRDTGEVVPQREVVRTVAHMEPRKIDVKVFRPGSDESVLRFGDDGTQIWEELAARRLTHPDRPPFLQRDLFLCDEARIDGCLFGNLTASWLGDEPSFLDYVERRILAAVPRSHGLRGHPCWVVESETGQHGPGMICSRHVLWFDQSTNLLVQREVEQTAYTEAGTVLQVIKRVSVFEPPHGK